MRGVMWSIKPKRKEVTMNRLYENERSLAILLVALALVGGTMISPLPVAANDLNVHPASCVAPFVDQAIPMRWHENFLMNPANNVPTWVICPLNFDNDVLIAVGASCYIAAYGTNMPGAEATFPQCYFSVHSGVNQQLGDYASGTPVLLTFRLATVVYTGFAVDVGVFWTAETVIFPAGIVEALASVPGSENMLYASIFCRLPAGYAITGITVTDERTVDDLAASKTTD
jgi:hypothetical protein